MEQKLIIRTPSKATKTTSTPKTASHKASSFEDAFARTVSVSSPSPSSVTFSKVSPPTVSEKTQSVTHFRQQLHEVQSIVCRFEGEIQLQQQEGLKASWEIAELQTQFDYLLRTTEELAQNNSGEFARLDLLYERYEHILEIFNKFEVALVGPLKENASIRESLIADEAQFRQNFSSDVELLNDQVRENLNHMNAICEMGNVMHSITEEQDLMVTRLDNNDAILFARMKEKVENIIDSDNNLDTLNQKEAALKEVFEMGKSELFSQVTKFLEICEEQESLKEAVENNVDQFNLIEDSLQSFKQISRDAFQFARAEKESLVFENKQIDEENEKRRRSEEEINRLINEVIILYEFLKREMAEKEFLLAENSRTLQEEEECVQIASQNRLKFCRNIFTLSVYAVGRFNGLLNEIETIREMISRYHWLKCSLLEKALMKIAEKESELYHFYARFAESETLMSEIRMKQEETWKRIIDVVRDYEQQKMRLEDIISSRSAYLRDRDVFFENMNDKEEYLLYRDIFGEKIDALEDQIAERLQEINLLNDAGERIQNQEQGIMSRARELKMLRNEAIEMGIMLQEDFRTLHKETFARYGKDLKLIDQQCAKEKSEIENLIDMLKQNIASLKFAEKDGGFAIGVPCFDADRSLGEEISELECEISRLEVVNDDEYFGSDYDQAARDQAESLSDSGGSELEQFLEEGFSAIFQVNPQSQEISSIEDWFQQSLIN
mmetsp:Transcript_4719/g.5176  ORF Transcript_4719/g.5176 Transcript_4719/m.5176 type:complete len:724 (+) Transcript_4719:126-2297(+)